MTWIAWAVFFAFLVWVVWDGLRRTRDSTDLEGYYAGNRRIPWWAAGLSVMATQASAITVIGTTGEGHEGGMGFLQIYLGLPFAMILMCVVLIPLYRRQPILTAYEYLEHRYNLPTRLLGSAIFLVSRCLALGIVIYAPAVVLSAMTGLSQDVTVLIIGGLTTLYTVFGGVSAVIWTDVKQMSVIVLGLFAVLGLLLWEVVGELGLGGTLHALGAAGKLNALDVVPASTELVPRMRGAAGEPTFWEQKYNVWSGLLGGLFLSLAYFGCDQSQVQRVLTNPTANESRKAVLMSAFAKVPMQALVLFLGALLYLFHALHTTPMLYDPIDVARSQRLENREKLADFESRWQETTDRRRTLVREVAALDADPRSEPELLLRYQTAIRDAAKLRREAAAAFNVDGKKQDTNYIFPHFIMHHLNPLLLGLILAAIFAAAMSSVDSVLNSLSAATIVDFHQRLARRRLEGRQSLIAGRTATLFWGAVATFSALWLGGGGSIIEWINRIGSYFYGTLLGGFVLGLVVPAARGWSAFVGMLGGIASVTLVHNTIHVEYLWYNVIGCAGVLLAGGAWTLFARRS